MKNLIHASNIHILYVSTKASVPALGNQSTFMSLLHFIYILSSLFKQFVNHLQLVTKSHFSYVDLVNLVFQLLTKKILKKSYQKKPSQKKSSRTLKEIFLIFSRNLLKFWKKSSPKKTFSKENFSKENLLLRQSSWMKYDICKGKLADLDEMHKWKLLVPTYISWCQMQDWLWILHLIQDAMSVRIWSTYVLCMYYKCAFWRVN